MKATRPHAPTLPQGISFNLIIIRIDQGKTVETEYNLQTNTAKETDGQSTKVHFSRLVFNRAHVSTTTTTVDVDKEHVISLKEAPGPPLMDEVLPLQRDARGEVPTSAYVF